MTNHTLAASLVGLTLIGVSACSSPTAAPSSSAATTVATSAAAPAGPAAPASSPAASASPTPSASSLDYSAITAFVTQVFAYRYAEARSAVAAGSPASSYLDYQEALYAAMKATGGNVKPPKTAVTADEAAGTVHIKNSEQKVDWSAFTLDASGKITGWSTDPVGPLVGRLTTQPSSGSGAGAQFTLLGGYVNESSATLVLKFKASRDLAIYKGFSMTANGAKVTVDDAAYPGSVKSGTSHYVILRANGQATLPDSVTIPVYDYSGKKLLGRLTLTVSKP